MTQITVRTIALFGALLALAGCSTPDVVDHPVPSQEPSNWDSILANPAPVSVRSYRTGTFIVNPRNLIDADSELKAQFRPPEPGLPVYAHLVHHEKLGSYLIDTGFGADPHSRAGWLLNLFLRRNDRRFDVGPNEDLRSRLGGRVEEIDGVYLTHLHFDHISGAADLPPKLPIIAGPYYPSFSTRVAMGRYLAGRTLRELDFSTAPDMPPLGKSIDLLGDGSFWAIYTPGHTSGHLSFLVNGPKPVLFTGDVSHFGWSFRRGIPSVSTGGDAELQRQSLCRLREFVRLHPTVTVVYGHQRPTGGQGTPLLSLQSSRNPMRRGVGPGD